MKPRIAIPVPTTSDVAYNNLNWPAYAEAVLASGGEPVQFALTLSRREGLALAGTCCGVVLPGSPADVSPERYGQAREEATALVDPARETLDELLLEDAEGSGKPLLAICFGMQILNVRRGGTLVQDLHVLPVNHSAGRSVPVAHTVTLSRGSLLASMVDEVDTSEVEGALSLAVNSSHHQAVAIPGRELKISARCALDGVVEAVEAADASEGFLLGIQWHPERTFAFSGTSRELFRRLINVATSYQVKLLVKG